MRKNKEDIAKVNHHIRWAEDIHKRNERYSDDSNWWPFVQNINDVLDRVEFLTQRLDDIENTIDGVDGNIKNLRKILIILEVIDDRFIF